MSFIFSAFINCAAGTAAGFSAANPSRAGQKDPSKESFETITIIGCIAAAILGFLIPLVFAAGPITAALLFKSFLATQIGAVAGIALGNLITCIIEKCQEACSGYTEVS